MSNKKMLVFMICMLFTIPIRTFSFINYLVLGLMFLIAYVCNQKVDLLLLLMVLLLQITQALTLDNKGEGLHENIRINFRIFFPIVIALVIRKSFGKTIAYIKGIVISNLIISVYYFIVLAGSGFDANISHRTSIFRYFSVNVVATVLLLNSIVLLYYLFCFKPQSKKEKKSRKIVWISIILSIVVVLTSGSRSSFGLLLLISLSMILIRQDLKDVLKTLGIMILGVIGGLVLYRVNSALKLIIDRVLLAIVGGNNTVKGDIRNIIWENAFQRFSQYNHFIGSGSNLIQPYGYDYPAHNFLLEILLTDGYVGVCLVAIVYLYYIHKLLKNSSKLKKHFMITIILCFLLSAYVQPFYSTGIICQLVFWCGLYIIRYSH